MVPPDRLIVRRGHTIISRVTRACGVVVVVRRETLAWVIRGGRAVALRLSILLLIMLILARAIVRRRRRGLADKVVGDDAPLRITSVARTAVLVVVVRIRILEDDVPGVNDAGNTAQHAQRDVDQRVGAAETAFDPDCRGYVLAVVSVTLDGG